MRKRYEEILKTVLNRHLLRRRTELELSQEEMAHRLLMGCRTYIDLEHGKTGCSALTLVLFLLRVCDNPIAFLDELRRALEGCDTEAA